MTLQDDEVPSNNGVLPGSRISLQSARIEDPSVQALLQPWVEMECYQLNRGRKLAELDSLDLGTLQIVRERQKISVQKLGYTSADFCTVSICTPDPAARFSEHSGDREDTVFFMPGNVEFDIHVPAGGDCAYVGFSQAEFLRGAQALNPAIWERPPQGVVPLTTQGHVEFRGIVDFWVKTAQEASLRGEKLNPAFLRSHMLQTVLQIVTVTEVGVAPSFNERLQALEVGRTARTFVNDRLGAGELPTLVEICAELGVSERTLRYAFQEYVGQSPVSYLRACRLNKVRAVLAASDPLETTITQVAMHYGFMHLGRFSGNYKRMFGDTPSETLMS